MQLPFPTVCVVGLGTVGSALSARIARTGRRVICVEANQDALDQGRGRVKDALSALSAAEPGALMTVDVEYLVGTAGYGVADLVIEAVPERLDIKVGVLRQADARCSADSVFATTTTGLSVAEIASRTGRMSKVAGLHLCNPGERVVGGVMEVVHTPVTDRSVGKRLDDFVASLGITSVRSGDQPGFIGGALLLSYLNRAALMYEQGYASRDDIDAAMRLGCGMPVGPLAHLDAVGIDVAVDSLAALFERSGDHEYRPASVLSRMVDAGLFGKKSGRGFYRYPSAPENGSLDSSATVARHNQAPVRNIGVVGSGTMATGIAEVCARAGFHTRLVARTARRAEQARSAVEHSLTRGMRRSGLDQDQLEEALSLVEFGADLGALVDCDLVIESVSEDVGVKQQIFVELDAVTLPGTILATTTSSLSVLGCASVTSRPQDVIGLHFFNPAPRMRLVEVVPTQLTSDEVAARALGLVRALGKHPISCGDRTGFVVNALLFPYLNRAVGMLRTRFVQPDLVDVVVRAGHGFPLGPFQLLDVVGLDVSLAIQDRLHKAFEEPGLRPAADLVALSAAGYLGRKTGCGFYRYED